MHAPTHLPELIVKFREVIADFEKHLQSGTPGSTEDFARTICLAGRSVFSEFRALHIEHHPELPELMSELKEAHELAVQVLKAVPSPTNNTLDFLAAMERRLARLNQVRFWVPSPALAVHGSIGPE